MKEESKEEGNIKPFDAEKVQQNIIEGYPSAKEGEAEPISDLEKLQKAYNNLYRDLKQLDEYNVNLREENKRYKAALQSKEVIEDRWIEKTRHEIKLSQGFIADIKNGYKTFEVRWDDRDYQVGDIVLMRESDGIVGFTGKDVKVRITYVLRGKDAVKYGTQVGYCIWSFITEKNNSGKEAVEESQDELWNEVGLIGIPSMKALSILKKQFTIQRIS